MIPEEVFNKYFKEVKDSIIFTGDTLEVYLPERFEQHGCLSIGDEVSSLAIFDMLINGEIKSGLLLPAKIILRPSDVSTVTRNGDKFFKLEFVKNDVFIKNVNIVQDAQLAYIIFYEMINGGRVPDFMTYEMTATIFDAVIEVAGVKFPTDHVVFEMMTAMLHRDQHNISLQYRLADTSKPPMNIPMMLVSLAAMSTTARVVGSYMDDGIDSSLVNASDNNSDIEDLLRK